MFHKVFEMVLTADEYSGLNAVDPATLTQAEVALMNEYEAFVAAQAGANMNAQGGLVPVVMVSQLA